MTPPLTAMAPKQPFDQPLLSDQLGWIARRNVRRRPASRKEVNTNQNWAVEGVQVHASTASPIHSIIAPSQDRSATGEGVPPYGTAIGSCDDAENSH